MENMQQTNMEQTNMEQTNMGQSDDTRENALSNLITRGILNQMINDPSNNLLFEYTFLNPMVNDNSHNSQ